MSPDVLVIGGGVSGLCAAVECAARGYSVLLAEQKQHLGGRVYSFIDPVTGDEVDNGQHLLLGCYHSTLRYLTTVGTIGHLSLQSSLDISFRSTAHRYRMHAPMLPAPLHVFGALLGLGSLSMRERLSILRIAPALLRTNPAGDARLRTLSVDEWLTQCGQGARVKDRLWNILSIGMLNERPENASAALFVHVLRTVFLGARRDASIAVPQRGLSRLFGDGGAAYLASHGGSVLLNTTVDDIVVKNGSVESVRVGSERISPRVVVSAVPHHAAARLFGGESRRALPMLDEIHRFTPVPIVSIHVWYDRQFMEEEFCALLGSPIDWVFNKSRTGGAVLPGAMYLSLVISAARAESARTKEELVAMADREVRRFFPGARGAVLVRSLVIKERRATFAPSSGLGAWRPAHASAVRNLFIAGDWTDTGLPATIEGAAQSGEACAALAAEHLGGVSERKK